MISYEFEFLGHANTYLLARQHLDYGADEGIVARREIQFTPPALVIVFQYSRRSLLVKHLLEAIVDFVVNPPRYEAEVAGTLTDIDVVDAHRVPLLPLANDQGYNLLRGPVQRAQ
jgi:hypothetical protein